MILSPQLRPARAAAAIALLLNAWLLTQNALLQQSGVLPLDDSYIHLQYGWQAAQGDFLEYNPGDPPAAGATSLSYMLLLALGFVAGVSRASAPTMTLIIGIISFALSAALIADTARQLALRLGLSPGSTGLLAGLWFAGSGWMAWASLSGMDTGLLILFVSGALWASGTQRLRLAVLCAALAALTRPEAGLLCVALVAAEWMAPDRRDSNRRKRVIGVALSLPALLVSPMVNVLVTGSPSATGLLSKSWFTVQPFDLFAVLRQMGMTLVELAIRLLGGFSSDGHWHSFPAVQLFAAIGLVKLYQHTPSARRVALICLVWALGMLVATATLQTATLHHYRYQMPIYPMLALAGALGAAWLVARLVPAARLAQALLLLPAVIWSVFSAGEFARLYAADTRTTLRMQMALANWLRANTESDASVVVHDVGAIRFFGERRTLDSVGLTTAGMSEAYRNGPGAIYESLKPLRPEYYAVYPNAAPPYFGMATASELFGEELFRVHLADYSPYTAADDTQVISRAHWEEGIPVVLPQQPNLVEQTRLLKLVDAINLADLADEQTHGYAWWNRGPVAGFPSEVRRMTYRADPAIALTDGGRSFNGGQSFTLSTQPGQPLLLLVRAHQTTDLVLHVQVGGDSVGEWGLPAIPGEWLESAFLIPARFIRASTARITMTVQPDISDARFGAFFLWGYQGTLPEETRLPTAAASVAFGDVAQLLGYDLPATTVSPGDVLPLTLYWRRLAPPRADWRFFIHLFDPQNDTAAGIITQFDSAPRQGTYPLWVWAPDETLSETVVLRIPPKTPTGNYGLLVGVYDSADGARAQLDPNADYGENRFWLSPISVR